jgi:hypothetical protein
MNQQLISQKFRTISGEPILSFVSGSTMTVFEDSENITNTYRPESSKLQAIKYFWLADTIIGFSNLPENWDTYNADKIIRSAIDKALEILNHLNNKGLLSNEIKVNVFPMRDGGIQFEFDSVYICAELEISPTEELTFFLFDEEGDIIEKGELFELSELSTLLEEAQYA